MYTVALAGGLGGATAAVMDEAAIDGLVGEALGVLEALLGVVTRARALMLRDGGALACA